ncbi:hypothetical protein GLOTRDRAFT_137211, partial [Gloeophyllum trabeum ATCC 11539]
MPALQLDARSPDTPVVTVTSYIGDSPTAVVSTSATPGQNIPVPSIVGGVAGGVFLALIAVIGWTWWGKSIKRENEKRWREARKMLTTKENTRRNAYTGTTYPYLPSALVPKPDRKVKFAGSLRRKSGDETVPLADNREPTPTKDCFVHVQGIAITTDEEQPSKKEPIRPGVAPTGVPFGSASRIPTVRWDRGLIPRLEHKASTLTVGSESVYSTQSGEPHIERDSKGFFSALDPRRLSTWTRSSGSVYSQPDEPIPPPTLQPLPPVAVSQQQGRTPERHPKAAVDQ